MFAILIAFIFCIAYGHNLRTEAVYTILFVVGLPLWLSFAAVPLLGAALVTMQTIALWAIVETCIRHMPARRFAVAWQLGNVRLAVEMV